MNVFFQKKTKTNQLSQQLFLSDFKCTRPERVYICFNDNKASQKDLLMPEIKTALTTSLHNAAYVLKKVAASLFGFAVNHESVALSDSEACTVMYLLSKRYN